MRGKLVKQCRAIAARPDLPKEVHHTMFFPKTFQLKELNPDGTPKYITMDIPHVVLGKCQKKLARLWKKAVMANKRGYGYLTPRQLSDLMAGGFNG